MPDRVVDVVVPPTVGWELVVVVEMRMRHRVDETRFEVVDAIEVAEEEDEGRHFYLRLADGRVLFLTGQYLDEDVASRRFPAARVTVIRAPESGIVLSMRAEGEYVAPSAVRPSFSERERTRGRIPDDGEILETDFDRLRRRG